jgi:hypothetical protein
MKWIPKPSIVVRYCGKPFRVDSQRRQLYSVRQYSGSERGLARGTPLGPAWQGRLLGEARIFQTKS